MLTEVATEAVRKELGKVLAQGDRRENARRVRQALRELPVRVAEYRKSLEK